MTARTSAELPTWFRDLTYARVVSGVPSDATAVCHDSRQVVPDAVFVAISGLTVDGNGFIPNAISAGARSIIVQEDAHERWQRFVNEDVTFVAVPDARVALAEAASGFYGHPARTLGMIGVTGTDGKTTTTHLIAHVLNETGQRAGYLSSVEFGAGGIVEMNASHMTTLEATDMQRQLAKIRDAGGRYAVVEASSIGLDHAPRRRVRVRRRRVHEPGAGPPRLPRQHGGVPRCEGDPLPHAGLVRRKGVRQSSDPERRRLGIRRPASG